MKIKELLSKINLPLIPLDKSNHMVYGAILYILASFFLCPLSSLLLVYGVAFIKECRDQVVYNGFDWKDIAATVALPLLLVIKSLV